MEAVRKQNTPLATSVISRRADTYRVAVPQDVRATLDALRNEVVVIDRRGVIVFVNRAWRRFADANGFDAPRCGVGDDYLAICDEVTGPDAEVAGAVARGLRAVLAGDDSDYSTEYACASPQQMRWFAMHASRFEIAGAPHLLIAHEDISAVKGIEKTLRFSLSRFQAFMDNSPALAFLKDPHGRLVWVNRPFVERFGQPAELLIGQSDLELLPESAEDLRRNDAAALAAGGPIEVYETVRTPDGLEREFLVMKFPVRDVTGLNFVGGIAVDVTEQRRAEAASRDSEARLRLIAEQMPAIALTTDRELRVTSVSGAGLAALGMSAEQLVGRTAANVFGERAALSALPRVLAGESLGLDTEWAGRAFQVRFEPLRGVDGEILGTVGVAIDFTERKRTVRERAESAARMATLAEVSRVFAEARLDMRSVVETTVQAISETMRDGCILSVADASGETLQLLALHHADPEARHLAQRLMIEQPWSAANAMVAPVLRTARASRLWFDTPAAARAMLAIPHQAYLERFEMHGVLSVPLRVDGRTIGVLGVWRDRAEQPYTREDEVLLQDLADRAALAIANARLFEDVERRVGERTHALQIANEELEAFSYSVSHDLRAPLRAIVGFTQALREDCGATLDEDGQRYVQRVLEGGKRMEALIEALLTLSNIKRVQLERKPVAIGSLAREIGDELARANPNRQVRLMVRDDSLVHADERLIRVALENLLGNAWKYTSKRRQATVEFGVRPLSEVGETVFFVRDDGAGFDMGLAEKIFDPFERLHGTGEFTGSGIGLATVQRIILRHGGRIWADAAPDRGATFYFTVPSH